MAWKDQKQPARLGEKVRLEGRRQQPSHPPRDTWLVVWVPGAFLVHMTVHRAHAAWPRLPSPAPTPWPARPQVTGHRSQVTCTDNPLSVGVLVHQPEPGKVCATTDGTINLEVPAEGLEQAAAGAPVASGGASAEQGPLPGRLEPGTVAGGGALAGGGPRAVGPGPAAGVSAGPAEEAGRREGSSS